MHARCSCYWSQPLTLLTARSQCQCVALIHSLLSLTHLQVIMYLMVVVIIAMHG